MTIDTPNGRSAAVTIEAPVSQSDRVQSIDVLRGVAILGILVMNVQAFVMPMAAYSNPEVWGSLEGRHYWVWYVSHLLFDMKFMAIFSMLFGAGVILLTTRLEATGRPAAKIHYRRTMFLLLIGMAHAYLLWMGDILVLYAVCALFLYLFRHMKPLTLAALGVLFIGVAAGMTYQNGLYVQDMQTRIAATEARLSDAAVQREGDQQAAEVPAEGEAGAEGEQLTQEESDTLREQLEADRRQVLAQQDSWDPSAESLAEESRAMRGTWWEEIRYRAPIVFGYMHVLMIPFWGIWRAGGLMMIGMALYKTGCFSARWRTGTYLGMWLVGWAVGLPVVAYGAHHAFVTDWSLVDYLLMGAQFNYWGSIPVSLGWVGLVMCACRIAKLASSRVMQALSAVGQTALSNYLLHTLVFTLIANGRGFGYFGQIERSEQAVLTVCIWIVQLCISYWWVRHYRFGPAEWLWRSLTYWRLQPMRMPGTVGA